MNLADVMADLRATRRFPTEEEAELIAREGTLQEVGDALVTSCCLNERLKARYNALRRAAP